MRSTRLVPELAGSVNTQVAEQLYREIGKDKYFLNMLNPLTHIFLFKSILATRNEIINKTRWAKQEQILGAKLQLDDLGRLQPQGGE